MPGVSECGAKCGDRLGDFVYPAAYSSATADVPTSTNSLFEPFEVSVGVECYLLGPDYMSRAGLFSRAASLCRDDFQPGIT